MQLPDNCMRMRKRNQEAAMQLPDNYMHRCTSCFKAKRAVLRLNRRSSPRGGCEPKPRLPGPADEGGGGPPPGRPGAERAPVPRNTSTPSMPAPRVQRSTATAPKARQGALPRSPAAASRPPTGSVRPQALANLSAGHKGPWSWRYLAGQYHATDGAPPSGLKFELSCAPAEAKSLEGPR